jgi:hypothetical protein
MKPLKKTRYTELLNLIILNCPDCMEFMSVHYTCAGIQANIKDKFDSQEYTITVEPLGSE